jgi:2'-5' RNA ligase
MRVFAALPLPQAVRSAVESLIATLRGRYPRLRCVRPEGLHLTLHFFGELEEQAVADLKALWNDPRMIRPAITAAFGSLGQFPPGGTPRVIWLGVEKGREKLAEFSAAFQSLIHPLGYREAPRGFAPHLTIARNNGERIDGEWIRKTAIPVSDFLFSECVLFRSILKPDGADYSALARASFTGGGNETG